MAIFVIFEMVAAAILDFHKKLCYRRWAAQRDVSVEFLPTAA